MINLIMVAVFLGSVSSLEDAAILKGYLFFEQGEYLKAQQSLSNSLPRAHDVAKATWFLALTNIALAKQSTGNNKDELLSKAARLLESLAGANSSYSYAATLAFCDCVLASSMRKNTDNIAKCQTFLKNATLFPELSINDLDVIANRKFYLAFYSFQIEPDLKSTNQNNKNEGNDNTSPQTKSSNPLNNKANSETDKNTNSEKGEKTNSNADATSDKSQAGKGNSTFLPYQKSLNKVTKEEAAEIIKQAASKIRKSSNSEDNP